MKKPFLSVSAILLFFGVVLLILNCGGGDKGTNSGSGIGGGGTPYVDHGNCATCTGDKNKSDCNSGYWCAPFWLSPNRCVPNSVRPQDPYTCVLYYESLQPQSQGKFEKVCQ
jgi:hypothetical protein